MIKRKEPKFQEHRASAVHSSRMTTGAVIGFVIIPAEPARCEHDDRLFVAVLLRHNMM